MLEFNHISNLIWVIGRFVVTIYNIIILFDRFVKKPSMMDVEKGRTSPWEEHKWEGVPKIQVYHSLKVIIPCTGFPWAILHVLTVFWSRRA